MPELPEVETTRRGIAPHVERQKVTAVRIYDRRLRWPVPRDLPRRLVGRVVDRVDRRSKYLLFRLGADTLIVHFGMTGSLRVYGARRRDARTITSIWNSTTALSFATTTRAASARCCGHLPRRASIRCCRARTRAVLGRVRRGLPVRATRKRSTAIKLALMDNHLVVGVGNIYANEALFRAGIRRAPPTACRASGSPAWSRRSRKRSPRRSPRAAARFAITSIATARPATFSSSTTCTVAKACPAARR